MRTKDRQRSGAPRGTVEPGSTQLSLVTKSTSLLNDFVRCLRKPESLLAAIINLCASLVRPLPAPNMIATGASHRQPWRPAALQRLQQAGGAVFGGIAKIRFRMVDICAYAPTSLMRYSVSRIWETRNCLSARAGDRDVSASRSTRLRMGLCDSIATWHNTGEDT
jgi:hypothetical protein